ncbi:ABC transporter ATP-binding protein [Burkholderia thailandensis]|nr:ABC transporter ATP-binding protein [Burkholderia thailandensis]
MQAAAWGVTKLNDRSFLLYPASVSQQTAHRSPGNVAVGGQ